ncbi:hypothetical protein ES703_72271 [subsurface metagenome]
MRVETTITQQYLEADPEFFGILFEIGPEQPGVKGIIPRRNRSVGCKGRARQDDLPGGVKREPVFLSHNIDLLQRGKG